MSLPNLPMTRVTMTGNRGAVQFAQANSSQSLKDLSSPPTSHPTPLHHASSRLAPHAATHEACPSPRAIGARGLRWSVTSMTPSSRSAGSRRSAIGRSSRTGSPRPRTCSRTPIARTCTRSVHLPRGNTRCAYVYPPRRLMLHTGARPRTLTITHSTRLEVYQDNLVYAPSSLHSICVLLLSLLLSMLCGIS